MIQMIFNFSSHLLLSLIHIFNLASKLLSQQLDAEGQRQLIDRYLDELGEA